jgi:hypothetical protein
VRVPPPGSLKLDRDLLLEDVRARISARLPQYADGADPTDPAWLLLEQAAWLAELHSQQLDRYPFQVVQYFVHMMGGELRPAHPALGVIVAQVISEGQIKLDPENPSEYRFFTGQTEERDAIEFVPVESLVDLRLAEVVSIVEIRHGELFVVAADDEPGPGDLEGHVVWRGGARRSRLFEAESIRYTIVTATPDKTLEELKDAITRLDERHLGWLKLTAEVADTDKVTMLAEIDPALAFQETVPGGLCPGGDIEGQWGTLDDSTWTPPVTIQEHGMLPPSLRGSRPMPGVEEGRMVIPDVPMNYSTADLLERRAEPIPGVVVDALWETIGNMNAKLGATRPRRERLFSSKDGDVAREPVWLAGALESGIWDRIGRAERQTVFHVALAEPRTRASRLRIALVFEGEANEVPAIEVFGIDEAGRVTPAPVKVNVAWRLPLPSRDRQSAMELVVALDVAVDAKGTGVLVSTREPALGLFINPILVANMATVSDGRLVSPERNIPEPVTLLHENVVTEAVVAQLLEQAIPQDAAAVIRNFPIAWFEVDGADPIANWEGVSVDAAAGVMTMNAPDAEGQTRSLRPGDSITLAWYRRTDGAQGDVTAGEIELVEEGPGAEPSIFAVRNPLGTFYGADRESAESAVDRLFAPSQGTPVLPGDFERVVRQALGSRARGWDIRVWTYAERSLLSTSVWPIAAATEPMDPETARLIRDLPRHGPSTLLVAVGPRNGQMSADDLDWARKVVGRTIRDLSRRAPTIREAFVTRLWPLTLHVTQSEDAEQIVLPSHDLAAMRGRLVDTFGRAATPPAADLLLNGIVTRVVVDTVEAS